MVLSSSRKPEIISNVFCIVCPALIDLNADACITDPSAIGSLNGIPISIISAPASGSFLINSNDRLKFGSPAVKNVMSAFLFFFDNLLKQSLILLFNF